MTLKPQPINKSRLTVKLFGESPIYPVFCLALQGVLLTAPAAYAQSFNIPPQNLTVADATQTPPENTDEGQTLDTVKVEADAVADDESSDVYNPNYSGKNTFYKKSNSTSATKTDTPIFDTPVSIVSIPRGDGRPEIHSD